MVSTVERASLGRADKPEPSRQVRIRQALLGATACVVIFVVALLINTATNSDDRLDGVDTVPVVEAETD